MDRNADEQRAIAHESRRVRSALDALADLAGRRNRPAVPPAPRPVTAPAPVPEVFPARDFPPPESTRTAAPGRLGPKPPPPSTAPAADDWFGDDDALAFGGTTASAGEVDFNSTPGEVEDTLGIRNANSQDTPPAGTKHPAPAGPVSEAINDVLDGFEW